MLQNWLARTVHTRVLFYPSFRRAYCASATRVRRERPPPLVITDAAANRLNDLMRNNEGAKGVVLGVKTRGCNGLSYTMNYVEEVDPSYENVAKDGVTVYIEPKALFHLIGTTMDFKIDHLTAEFVFENPNATGMCGCGESFSVG